METFSGKTISWDLRDHVVEIALDREPCNEIGSETLEELEQLAASLPVLEQNAHALVIYSKRDCGFCAGADLRELYKRAGEMEKSHAAAGLHEFLERIHHVMNTLDASPLTTIAVDETPSLPGDSSSASP